MNDLPKRKSGRLKGYDYSRNGAYFITICVQGRHEMLGKIVAEDSDPHIELSEYGIIVDKYLSGMRGIQKYVIMPNHIHLIIAVGDNWDGSMWSSTPTNGSPSVSQIIKSFKTLVTKEIGFSMFQRSFHDHIIRNESEYQKIWQYIDTNPHKWKEDCFYVSPRDRNANNVP